MISEYNKIITKNTIVVQSYMVTLLSLGHTWFSAIIRSLAHVSLVYFPQLSQQLFQMIIPLLAPVCNIECLYCQKMTSSKSQNSAHSIYCVDVLTKVYLFLVSSVFV